MSDYVIPACKGNAPCTLEAFPIQPENSSSLEHGLNKSCFKGSYAMLVFTNTLDMPSIFCEVETNNNNFLVACPMLFCS